MYRVHQRRKTKPKVVAKKRSNDDRIADILVARNIHMRCFHDIPMADLEMIFPDKKVKSVTENYNAVFYAFKVDSSATFC
jgi:Flp pilus assembly CpaF family ATPase